MIRKSFTEKGMFEIHLEEQTHFHQIEKAERDIMYKGHDSGAIRTC